MQANDALKENAAKLPYRLIADLLYYNDSESGLRLCIPESVRNEVFRLVHDEIGHPGYRRTHERLTQGVYILDIAKWLRQFIKACPQCQYYDTPRHKTYGSLQPILSPPRPFHTITIDFILTLPLTSEGYNQALTMTCKASKAISLMPGSDKWDGERWGLELLRHLALIHWGLPKAILSDRDPKFVGGLFRAMFKQLNVTMIFSTAWHPQTDGSSERSNQTIEIALRHFLSKMENPTKWPKVLGELSLALFCAKSASINMSASEATYGFKVNEIKDLIPIPTEEGERPAVEDSTIPTGPAPTSGQTNSAKSIEPSPPAAPDRIPSPGPIIEAQPPREPIPSTALVPFRKPETINALTTRITKLSERQKDLGLPAKITEYRETIKDAQDSVAFAVVKQKLYYDQRHKPMFFKVGDQVKLRLHRGYNVPQLIKNKKINQQWAGPFTIKERIGTLAYRLDFPQTWRPHPVISVTMLEPWVADPWNRKDQAPPPVTVDGEVHYEIDRIIMDRWTRRGRGKFRTEYLVRWKGYGPEDDSWLSKDQLPAAQGAIKNYEQKRKEAEEESVQN